LQRGNLLDAQCTLEIHDAVVESEVHHFVEPGSLLLALPVVGGDAVIAERAHPPGKCRIVGRDHPTFARRDMLDRVEAESFFDE
jgi:hypothetical protein